MWDQVPESVRLQYTGTSELPGIYRVPDAIRHAAAQKAPATRNLCIVCLERPFTHAFVPCMHRCVCVDCAAVFDERSIRVCPLCRKPLSSAPRCLTHDRS